MIVEPVWQSLISDDERQLLSPGVPDALPARPDILIVGGGVVGLSIAWSLAEREAGSVLLVEQADLASGASGVNGGGLFAGQIRREFPPVYRELGLTSREIHANWADQDWADFEWNRNGSLAISADEFPCPMQEYVTLENADGCSAEYLTGDELREIEPALNDEITEAVYYRDDATLNPLRLSASLARAVSSSDVTLATSVRVEMLKTHGNRVEHVATTAGEVRPGTVILTTGWSAGRLIEPLGFRLPLQPAKGQLLATGPLEWHLETNLLGTQLLRQLPTNEIVTGGSIEFVGEDYEPRETITQEIAETARRAVPALAAEQFVRVWTGLRPHTPDEMPIIDRLSGCDNVFIAAGHFTKGVLFAPVTGRLVADWVMSGCRPEGIDFLRCDRFD